MIMVARLVLVSTWITALAIAQPAFEVASIRAVNPATPNVKGFGEPPVGYINVRGQAVHFQNANLRYLIAVAYRVRAIQVSGPAWLSDARFDIKANVPAGWSSRSVNEMLQTLLVERFGLKVHQE